MNSMSNNPYQSTLDSYGSTAAAASEWERTTFIRKTYIHLAGAIATFVLLEVAFLTAIPEHQMIEVLRWIGTSSWNWLIVLGAFMGVSYIANSWALNSASLGKQYAGLSLYVVAEAIIFLPILFYAHVAAPETLSAAALMTMIVFTGLTLLVFVTKADFSWLGRYLMLAGFAALGFILCSAFIGFNLGVFFCGAMVVFAAASILYSTSNVLHNYRTNQYVAAALSLFASVALLFWYILQLFLAFRD